MGPPADALRCELALETVALGEPGDGPPSSPVVLGDGFAVAFTRTTRAGTELLVQRVRFDGTLEPPTPIRSGVHASRPFLVGDGERAYVLAITQRGATEAIPLEPDGNAGAPPVTLPHPPEDVALGPRGLIYVHRDEDRRVVVRDGQPDVRLPAPPSIPEPRPPILASGPAGDLVLVRHGRSARVALLSGGSTTHSDALFRGGRRRWAEAGLAAGSEGFVVVRTGPEIGDLEVYPVGSGGAVGEAIPIPPPASHERPPGALVRRYPRAASLGDGWALSYWDGTGPSLVRIDRSGQITADAIALRSGDERGGHTDARMLATDEALAVSWQVEPPRMSHGLPEEQPRRPGPRLGVLRCAD